MPLVKHCPSCNGRMLPAGARESLRSLLRHPNRGKCPHCSAPFRVSIGYWLVAHIGGVMTAVGALGLLGLTFDLISPAYTLVAFLMTALGISIMFFGLSRMRLEKAGE